MNRELYLDLDKLEDRHFWFKGRREIILSVLKKYAPLERSSNFKVLELGCGTGGNLVFFEKYFPQICGSEINDLAIEIAESKTTRPVKKGELPNGLEYDEKFDFIFLFDVLEHVEEERESLVAIKELLKKGGKAVITVPAHQFLWSQHDVDHMHYRRYTKKTLMEVTSLAGYHVNYISYFNFFLFPLVFLVRKLGGGENNTRKMNPVINFICYVIFSSEKYILNFFRFPTGVSLISVIENN